MQNNTESELENPKARAEELLNNLRKGKGVFDIFSDSFRKHYLIGGKTVQQWEERFKIAVPSELDPARCKELDIKLMELHQEASFYKATADAIYQSLKKGSETEFRNRFTAIVEAEKKKNTGKLPSATTLENLAKNQIDDVDTAVVSADIASQFWQGIIDHLTFCRKLLELGVMTAGIEAKVNQSERYIDALNNKNNQYK